MIKKRRRLNWVINILIFIMLILGLVLIFNEQLKVYSIEQMTNNTMKKINREQIQKAKNAKATYDFKQVKALSASTVTMTMIKGQEAPTIGKMSIPSVGLKLPVLKGLDNYNLSLGAGTMKADQEMGKGNYALAGHYMTNQGVLFSPLKNVSNGDYIYLTNMKRVYKYKVYYKKIINKTDVNWIYDSKGEVTLTLITCASPTEGEVDRIMVRATFQGDGPYDEQSAKLF
ncbi:class A sortase [Xylocopilactobacillus apicola]|uniref:Class A sortase n=1 Tax=Xylocopilactobacillus apicola TaxID=2932184 RepID=A0AAU9DVW8_9LACO|nr:class A sortase [Xylocopilactobacillus apicola]BDR59618.1 class A sortase [Xylocopilactobacillus apicola]